MLWCIVCLCWNARKQDLERLELASPQSRIGATSHLNNDATGASRPGVRPSVPSGLLNSNDNANAKEARRDKIRNNLVFQRILSLPSCKEQEVFFHRSDDSTGVDKEEILTSEKPIKDQLTCSICLEEYVVGDLVVRLKRNNTGDTTNDGSRANACKHCFHEDCILEWLESHDECPLCRVNMLTATP